MTKGPAAPKGDGWSLGHRPSLDALRGAAVLLVIAAHSTYPATLFETGKVGVVLFFALSGYLITGVLLDDWRKHGRVRFGRFYLRRARRLLPALIVLVGLLLGLGMVSIAQAGPALFYFANFVGSIGPLSHTWSLATEEQFYLVWPAALVLMLRVGLWPWAVVGIGAAMTLVHLEWAGALVMGGGVTLVSARRGRDLTIPPWLFAIALVVLALPNVVATSYAAIALAAPVVVAFVASRPALSWRPLELVGKISYGIYLWHYPLMVAFAGYWWAPVALLPASLVVAWASWVLVERRFLDRRAHDVEAVRGVRARGAIVPYEHSLAGVANHNG